MFAPDFVGRRRVIHNWVTTAINATTLAHIDIRDGKLSVQHLNGVLDGVRERVVDEIMKVSSKTNIEPSLN